MITKTIQGGSDTWTDQTHPGTHHFSDIFLRVAGSGSPSLRQAFLLSGWKPPRGVQIISAKLRLRNRNAFTGSRTVSAQRISQAWKTGRTVYSNRPGVTGPIASVTIGTTGAGDLVELDVTAHLQSVANGASFYGWRISSTATTAHSFWSLNAGSLKPELYVQYAYQPAAPTGLVSGGAVSTGAPNLHFSYNVFSGNLGLRSIQVQIDPAANGAAPAWDSGADGVPGSINTDLPEVDLSTTSYPGLAAGATTFWRVRYTTTDGLTSPWSSWATFSRIAKGTATLDAPAVAPNDLVTESTPPIMWTFSNQTRWQVIITPAGSPSKILHNTGVQSGTDQSYTLPSKVLITPGGRYNVRVRLWDNIARMATAGDPTYVELSRDFTFAYSSATGPVTGLAIATVTPFPRPRLTWSRSSPPDSYLIERDGVVIADNLDPDDVFVSGTDYAWEDWTASPFADHTWKVVPVVNGIASDAGPTVTTRFRSFGTWIGDPATGWCFNLIEDDPSGLTYGEDADVTPKFAEVTRKVSSMRGLEGSITGLLAAETTSDARTLADQLADLLAIKGRGQRIFRLQLADMNVPVLVGALSPSPSSQYLEHVEVRSVSLSVWQKGELPFTTIAGA